MEKLSISKGLKIKFHGMPESSLIKISPQKTIGLSAQDIPYIRPKLLVKEKQHVKTGSPLFCDKRDKTIQYVSPATGTIQKIVFGPRRKLLEVVIQFDLQDDYVLFEAISRSHLETMPKGKLISQLKEGGLWQCFRQFPAKDTADADHNPPMIIVSLNGNDLFSPYPEVILDQQMEHFEYGLDILKKFSNRIIVAVNEKHYDKLGQIQKWISHTVPDMYPSWDPGVILYHIKESSEDNLSWCISLDHLIMMAKFISSGQYPVDKIMTLTKPNSINSHILTRQGVSINALLQTVHSEQSMTTGHFNGRIVTPNTHVGFFENTINIIPAQDKEKLFGFILPGLQTPSVSNTFLSRLKDTVFQMDATLHGEKRACINCSYCENICPNDLLPHFVMKAVVNENIEEALQLGLLDCCQCGLCSYTCPSKIELTTIFSNAIDSYYKDKV